MDHFQYFGLLVGCLVVTVPLEFIYGFRLWRRPLRLVRAVLPGVILFTIWDVFAISRGHWRFNSAYVTGGRLPGGVPVEEFTFFVVVPVAAIAGFEAVRAGLARSRSRTNERAGTDG